MLLKRSLTLLKMNSSRKENKWRLNVLGVPFESIQSGTGNVKEIGNRILHSASRLGHICEKVLSPWKIYYAVLWDLHGAYTRDLWVSLVHRDANSWSTSSLSSPIKGFSISLTKPPRNEKKTGFIVINLYYCYCYCQCYLLLLFLALSLVWRPGSDNNIVDGVAFESQRAILWWRISILTTTQRDAVS